MTQIIQIVPALPPAINGLGDYALNLARQFRQDFNIDTHFIVGNPRWSGSNNIEGFIVDKLPNRSKSALLDTLRSPTQQPSNILLHYVGYGYAKRGCPFWMAQGLEAWKTRNSEMRLVTMFHEIYARNQPPWTSAFWLLPWQKQITARILRQSDRALTSKQFYAQLLHQLQPNLQFDIPTLPVFSNIGEPSQTLPLLKDRAKRLIVFGGAGKRRRVYQTAWAQLSRTCELLGIESVWDIGPPTGLAIASIEGVPFVERGELPAAEISDILSHSIAGFFSYPPELLGKSTIFAAYCAHRVLPIGAQWASQPEDKIYPGKHYWVPDDHIPDLKDQSLMQAIANNAHQWYQTHNLSTQARIFESLFENFDIELSKS